jgi:hypothetical protein
MLPLYLWARASTSLWPVRAAIPALDPVGREPVCAISDQANEGPAELTGEYIPVLASRSLGLCFRHGRLGVVPVRSWRGSGATL